MKKGLVISMLLSLFISGPIGSAKENNLKNKKLIDAAQEKANAAFEKSLQKTPTHAEQKSSQNSSKKIKKGRFAKYLGQDVGNKLTPELAKEIVERRHLTNLIGTILLVFGVLLIVITPFILKKMQKKPPNDH